MTQPPEPSKPTSHTPDTAIPDDSGQIAQQTPSSEVHPGIAESIQSVAILVATLVANVLALAACSSGHPPLQPGTFLMSDQRAVAGQSNAIGLRPYLEAYTPIVGTQLNNTPIAAWAPGQADWTLLETALRGTHPSVFIWYQGETDALLHAIAAAQYRAKLEDLIVRVRAVLGYKVPVLIVGLADDEPGEEAWWQLIRQAQQDTAAANGWLYITAQGYPLADVRHLNAAGYQALALDIQKLLVPKGL